VRAKKCGKTKFRTFNEEGPWKLTRGAHGVRRVGWTRLRLWRGSGDQQSFRLLIGTRYIMSAEIKSEDNLVTSDGARRWGEGLTRRHSYVIEGEKGIDWSRRVQWYPVERLQRKIGQSKKPS